MARAIISPKFYAWDRDGKPLAFGKVYTYQARTNTPRATYQSEDQVVPNTNPVILNGEGYANIYLDGSYKIVVKDKDENEIWSADPVTQGGSSDGDTYSEFTLTAYYSSPTELEVIGDYTSAILEGMRITLSTLQQNGKDKQETSTVISSAFDGSRTSVVISDPIVTTSIKYVSVTNWPFEEIEAIEEFVESDELTFETPQGQIKKTITGIETLAFSKVASVPLNGGVWDESVVFNQYNEYMVYNGVAYKPKPGTDLPYVSTITPDLSFVEPFSDLNTGNADYLQNQVSGLSVWPINTNQTAQVGDNLPAGTDALRDANNSQIYALSDQAVGVISSIDFNSGRVTVAGVDFFMYPISFNYDIGSLITYEVGPGGDFQSINDALKTISSGLVRYLGDNTPSINIVLKSGFVIEEQVLLDGKDFGFVVITAEDLVTSVDESFITEYLVYNASQPEYSENLRPVFGGNNNSVLPIIGFQADYGINTHGKDGVAVLNGSKVVFLPESGIRKCFKGLSVSYGSQAFCHIPGVSVSGGDTEDKEGVDFSGCASDALRVQYSSIAGLHRSHFENSEGAQAVYVRWNAYADIFQSFMSNAVGNGVTCRDGAKCNARQTDVDGCKRGYSATHQGEINARAVVDVASPYGQQGAKNCTEFAISATDSTVVAADTLVMDGSATAVNATSGARVNVSGGSALNCTVNAITASGGGHVVAAGVDVSGSAGLGFSANKGSTISADGAAADNCGDKAVFANENSHINVFGISATNCQSGTGAIVAERGSSISCDESDVSDSASNGYRATYNSNISADRGTADNCGGLSVQATEASTVQARELTANGMSGGDAIYALRGSTINCRGCNTDGDIHALEMGQINAHATTCDNVKVERGAIINAGFTSGTLNQTKNVPTLDGIIFKE